MTIHKKSGAVKNEHELQVMRENAKVHKEVFEAIKQAAKPWVSAIEIDTLCWKICSSHHVLCGFKGVYNFPANICISVNNCVVHGIPKKSMIFQHWDVVTFDFWVKDKKYWLNTDAAFTMIIWDGPHDTAIEKFLKVSQEALYKWIAKAVVGNRVWDIWHAVQAYVESHGYHIIKDLTGHAIGYTLHERPYIPNFGQPGKWELLKENMTLAIEPIVGFSSPYISDNPWFEIYTADGWLGAQFEHTIVVKPGYPEILV